MIEKTIFGLVIALALFLAGGIMLPTQVHVERSIEIQRPVSTVFALVNSFESYPAWSPLTARDPGLELEVSGSGSGVGARLNWSGDPRLVGTGWQQIVNSQPGSLIEIRTQLDLQGAADMAFHFEKIAGGVHLTWNFDADLTQGQGMFGGLLARYFGLMFDRWIGDDLELGLQRLKTLAEALPAADFGGLEVAVVNVKPMDILFVSSHSPESRNDIATTLAGAFRELTAFMAVNGLEMSAQPMAIMRSWDERGFRFDAAIPVEAGDIVTGGRVQRGVSPSGRAVRVVHRGSYADMARSYEKLAAYMAVHGMREGRVSWEHYISDPGQTAVDERITHVYFLIDETPPEDKP
jgi:effector-binding domain-containing protein